MTCSRLKFWSVLKIHNNSRASELGATSAAAALVAAGADGRAHPVTKYGPLYIACYHGHLDIAKLLLQHFPEAVQVLKFF